MNETVIQRVSFRKPFKERERKLIIPLYLLVFAVLGVVIYLVATKDLQIRSYERWAYLALTVLISMLLGTVCITASKKSIGYYKVKIDYIADNEHIEFDLYPDRMRKYSYNNSGMIRVTFSPDVCLEKGRSSYQPGETIILPEDNSSSIITVKEVDLGDPDGEYWHLLSKDKMLCADITPDNKMLDHLKKMIAAAGGKVIENVIENQYPVDCEFFSSEEPAPADYPVDLFSEEPEPADILSSEELEQLRIRAEKAEKEVKSVKKRSERLKAENIKLIAELELLKTEYAANGRKKKAVTFYRIDSKDNTAR